MHLHRIQQLVLIPLILGLALLALDALFPFPMPADEGDFASVVTDDQGVPLRSFADSKGVWRYAITPENVSPLYLHALLNYEDRWFYQHPGVNPLALIRATWQAISQGKIISGGSTLTMQVARLLDPVPRTMGGKFKQILRALQLEWHLDKREILTLYLNYAPFGGPIEGIEAASYTYLGKPSKQLTHAEAALLAVLPQRPSRLRPDRHPLRAQTARDKVIRRLAKQGVWSQATATEAMQEPVAVLYEPNPKLAPLLARRLHQAGQVTRTHIWSNLQANLEERLTAWSVKFPATSSAAVLVMENQTLAVRAYLGSLDFNDATRFGHVDMVRAKRSPGSTLKPFLYGLALDQGLIHSGSLLSDAPLQLINGYQPKNFSGAYSGPVSAEQALQRSLNPPAVDLLDRLGPSWFRSRLYDAGLKLHLPQNATANLSIILGGTATRLEELVGAYSALGREGLSGEPRLTPDQVINNHRLLSADAAWIIRRILQDNPRRPAHSGPVSIAWKTGTSYGFRDAWAIGVSDKFTIGVWVGRPDGTPTPGHYGAVTAAPLLFNLAAALPDQSLKTPHRPIPETVQRTKICWPLGNDKAKTDNDLCQQTQPAWVLKSTVPPTLPPRDGSRLLLTRWIDQNSGYLNTPDCPATIPLQIHIARWPDNLAPWLNNQQLKRSQLPAENPLCRTQNHIEHHTLKITGLRDGSSLRPAGHHTDIPPVSLTSQGGQGKIYWLINGQAVGRSQSGVSLKHRFKDNGTKEITAFDQFGNWHRITLKVMGLPSP